MEESAYRKFFSQPLQTYHRRCEALRAVFVEGHSQKDVANMFGYCHGTMREQAIKRSHYTCRGAAEDQFRYRYRWATHSRLKPMIDKAKLLKKHLPNILAYLPQSITNPLSESLNSKIQWVKCTTRGFRKQDNFKTAICFHSAARDLLPAS